MSLRTLRLLPLAAGALVALAAVAVLLLASTGDDEESGPPPAILTEPDASVPDIDPLEWDPSRREGLEARASLVNAHVLYAKTPGGVVAGAARTERFRGMAEEAAAQTGSDPDLLEAMVFLESSGRPEVIAGDDPSAAVGLTQILAETGQNLLGMRVHLEGSRLLGRRIARERRRGREARVERLRKLRRRIDERFDPRKALLGAGRYLEIARERFGREDLAIVSYHMGIGNLESVIEAFTGRSGPTQQIVEEEDLSWAELFFDSTPQRNPAAHAQLQDFLDDSATYYWRVLASREIMRLYRSDQDELERREELFTAKSTAEEVFHPEEETESFDDPDELRDARSRGTIVSVPDEPRRFWFHLDRRMGALARRLDEDHRLYRGLRREALATLIYIGREVQATTGRREALRVTSTVRDNEYQQLLRRETIQATSGYSLHTTGYSFDIARDYHSRAQAAAFQGVLDRLRAQAVIDWAREPGAIHITVSQHGEELSPLLGD